MRVCVCLSVCVCVWGGGGACVCVCACGGIGRYLGLHCLGRNITVTVQCTSHTVIAKEYFAKRGDCLQFPSQWLCS